MKKTISHRFSKLSKQKQRRLELQKAIKALRVMSNQPHGLESLQAVVSADTVVVKLRRHAVPRQQATPPSQVRPSYSDQMFKMLDKAPVTLVREADYVDASIGETERAVRTLQRKPSSEVNAFYKRLAKQRA